MNTTKAKILLVCLLLVALAGFFLSIGYTFTKKSKTDEELPVFSGISEAIINYTDEEQQAPGLSLSFDSGLSKNQEPSEVKNLRVASKGPTWIYWEWANPSDEDFDKCILYLNGKKVDTTKEPNYNATGLMPNTLYTLTINTRDTSWNINSFNVSSSQRTEKSTDTIPPSQVTSLQGTPAENSIYWTWANPLDADFYENEVYINGVFEATTFNNYYNATELVSGREYTISVYTKDWNGNKNLNPKTNTQTANDLTNPSGISNLQAASRGAGYITWTWANPSDDDIDGIIVRINSYAELKLAKNATSYTRTGLSSNAYYTINVTAVDSAGNRAEGVTNTQRTCLIVKGITKDYVVCP